MNKEDLIEFLNFLEEEGLITYDDKVEIFIKKNVERLKTLAYLYIQHIRNKIQNDEIFKYKDTKLRKILMSVSNSNTYPQLFTGRKDNLKNDENDLEKIVGD